MLSPSSIMQERTEARSFDTWEVFLDAFEILPVGFSAWDGRSADAGGCATLGAALAVARQGWPEGQTCMRDIAAPLLDTATGDAAPSDAGEWVWDVTGAAYDVGEYLTGNPECWLTRVPVEKRAVTILVNIATSAGVPTKSIKLRGATIVALVMKLQDAGHAVDLWAGWGACGDGFGYDKRYFRVRLVDPNGGPLDMDRVLFALAHPASVRQLGIGMTDNGIPIDNLPWKSDMYVPCMHLDRTAWGDQATVLKWIESSFQTLTKEPE